MSIVLACPGGFWPYHISVEWRVLNSWSLGEVFRAFRTQADPDFTNLVNCSVTSKATVDESPTRVHRTGESVALTWSADTAAFAVAAVVTNAQKQDPVPLDALHKVAANISWTSLCARTSRGSARPVSGSRDRPRTRILGRRKGRAVFVSENARTDSQVGVLSCATARNPL